MTLYHGLQQFKKHSSKIYRKRKSYDFSLIISEKYFIGSGNLHCGSDSQYISLSLKKLVLLRGFLGKPIQIT